MNQEERKNVSETLREKLILLNLKSSECVLRGRLDNLSNNNSNNNNKINNSSSSNNSNNSNNSSNSNNNSSNSKMKKKRNARLRDNFANLKRSVASRSLNLREHHLDLLRRNVKRRKSNVRPDMRPDKT